MRELRAGHLGAVEFGAGCLSLVGASDEEDRPGNRRQKVLLGKPQQQSDHHQWHMMSASGLKALFCHRQKKEGVLPGLHTSYPFQHSGTGRAESGCRRRLLCSSVRGCAAY